MKEKLISYIETMNAAYHLDKRHNALNELVFHLAYRELKELIKTTTIESYDNNTADIAKSVKAYNKALSESKSKRRKK